MQKNLRKPSKGEAFMYINLLWFAILAFAFIPIINNLPIQLVITFTDGNILYGALSENLASVRDVLASFAGYTGLGIFVTCILYFGKKAFGVITLAFASHAISYFISILTYALAGGKDVVSTFFLLGTDMLVNVAVYVIIYFALMHIFKKRDTFLNIPEYRISIFNTKHPLSYGYLITSAIYALAELAATLYTMIGDFLDPSLGPPINLKETAYWILQYLMIIVSFFVGYVIMMLVGALAERYRKRKF